MPILTIPQKNLKLEVASGSNLMQALIEAKIPVASSCLGDGICGKCVVKITPHQNAESELEKTTLQRNNKDSSYRLSCQVKINSSMSIETTYW